MLLKREGYVVDHKKLFGLYREEKLAVRRRGGRKRAIGARAQTMARRPPKNRLARLRVRSDHRRPSLRILTVVDHSTRECLALVADTSLSDTRVTRELEPPDHRARQA
ncbi:hypothetical protein DCG74_38120 [Bradyrhizobium sp. WBAH42]|nr:hypothetical protein DCG74_38120 [Bradyrhizobium sp. WBAH42]